MACGREMERGSIVAALLVYDFDLTGMAKQIKVKFRRVTNACIDDGSSCMQQTDIKSQPVHRVQALSCAAKE